MALSSQWSYLVGQSTAAPSVATVETRKDAVPCARSSGALAAFIPPDLMSCEQSGPPREGRSRGKQPSSPQARAPMRLLIPRISPAARKGRRAFGGQLLCSRARPLAPPRPILRPLDTETAFAGTSSVRLTLACDAGSRPRAGVRTTASATVQKPATAHGAGRAVGRRGDQRPGQSQHLSAVPSVVAFVLTRSVSRHVRRRERGRGSVADHVLTADRR